MNNLLPLAIVALLALQAPTDEQGFQGFKGRRDGGLSLHAAPIEVQRLLMKLESTGQFDKVRSVLNIHIEKYPLDPSLPLKGIKIAFLQGKYAEICQYMKMPSEFHEQFPGVWTLFTGSWSSDPVFFIAELNGVKTGVDLEQLGAAVMKEAWAKRKSLPFGMVTEEGIHVDKQVLTLLLLQDSFGSHRKLLFERAAKLAPNDTFILELRAQRLIGEGEEAQAVEMYKKAVKAKASEERVKHLKKALAETEKLAEWRKVIGPRTDKKDGGG